MERRELMAAIAVLVASAGVSGSAQATGMDATEGANGKPGDFNFLTGEWRIQNRRIKPGTVAEWSEFPAEATVWSILGGVVSVEELRIPALNFAGMGLRMLDVDRRIWSDYWVNAKSGVITPPPQTGLFREGVGIFIADEKEGELTVKSRGIWDRITSTSCRWYQSVSRDGGQTWKDNWFMDWRRSG